LISLPKPTEFFKGFVQKWASAKINVLTLHVFGWSKKWSSVVTKSGDANYAITKRLLFILISLPHERVISNLICMSGWLLVVATGDGGNPRGSRRRLSEGVALYKIVQQTTI
jgi:hypothetical protein